MSSNFGAFISRVLVGKYGCEGVEVRKQSGLGKEFKSRENSYLAFERKWPFN